MIPFGGQPRTCAGCDSGLHCATFPPGAEAVAASAPTAEAFAIRLGFCANPAANAANQELRPRTHGFPP